MATILILVMALTALSQFSGINGVIFYGPTILHSAGIVTQDALFISGHVRGSKYVIHPDCYLESG
ncbi:MAG: MFS transporter [Chitinophagaceae bacterium]|nr:MFS transporter [Chitinophagaceae bacterium]